MSFGHRLKILRKELRLTQSEVAAKIGISPRVFGYYESDNRFPKDPILIDQIASLFSVSTDYLIGRTEVRQGTRNHVTQIESQKSSIGSDLPDEAQEELRRYVELLQLKYGKK